MRNIAILLLVMIAPLISGAQSANNFDKVWVIGEPMPYTMTFNGSNVNTSRTDTAKRVFLQSGNTNICDSFGNVAIVCNGYTAFDKHLNVIDGGDTLVPPKMFIQGFGFSFYSQSSIILPFDNNIYYLVTPTASDSIITYGWNNTSHPNATFDLLLYALIDMNANSGAGKVIQKKVPLLQNVTLSRTQMMSCKHGDGKDWWLLKQAWGSNTIYEFLFRQDTVIGPIVQTFSLPLFNTFEQSGQSVFSKDGTKYATTCRGAHQIFVADFDRCTGILSNPSVYNVPINQPYWPNPSQMDSATNGLAFSPNGRFLYVNGWSYIQQMDLQAPNPDTTWMNVASADTTADFQLYSDLYLGPDDKLYVGYWNGLSQSMSVINNPNNKGTACNFCPKCVRFPTYNYPTGGYASVTTPPCMPNYHLGAANPTCWVVGVEEIKQQPPACSVSPNPATTTVTVKYSHSGTFSLFDITGKLISTHHLTENTDSKNIDISGLTPGLYIYHYSNENFQTSGRLSVL